MTILFFLCIGIYLCFTLFIIVGLFKHKTESRPQNNDFLKVSVVIAARNEENNISKLIDDLTNQTYSNDKMEIIIVNDRSTDKTGSILDRAAKKHPFIQHVHVGKNRTEMTPKKNALQKGIQQATGDIILNTDADCRVPNTWVSAMTSSVQFKKGIVIGFSRVSGNSFFHLYQMIDFLSITIANAGFGGWNIFFSGSGQNLAYSKSNFELIGGFEPVKNKISGDDMYLVQEISKIKRGYINIDRRSFVETKPVKTFIKFINQRVRWSSNSRENINKKPWFFCFLVSAFLCNLMLLIGIILPIKGVLFAFSLKFIFDGLVIFLGGKLFETPVPPIIYLFWAGIQPLYIPFIGLMGLGNVYTWKS